MTPDQKDKLAGGIAICIIALICAVVSAAVLGLCVRVFRWMSGL